MSGPIDRFVAAEHFVIGTDDNAPVKIAWLGNMFVTHHCAKTEENVQPSTVRIHELLRDAHDLPRDGKLGTLVELAGAHEISLAHFWSLLRLHRRDCASTALTISDELPNTAYIRGANGNLWAVHAHWVAKDGGWHIGASSVGRPMIIPARSRIISA